MALKQINREKCLQDMVRRTDPNSYVHLMKKVKFSLPDVYGVPKPPLTCNNVDAKKFEKSLPFGGCPPNSGCPTITTDVDFGKADDPALVLRDAKLRAEFANEKSGRNYVSVDKKVWQREWDINYWLSELDRETRAMAQEVEDLYKSKRLLAKTLRETEFSLETALKCIEWRDRRFRDDCSLDDVQKELYKEVEVVRCHQERIKDTLDRAEKLNKDTQAAIEQDKFDKFKTNQIEELCLTMRESSGGLKMYEGIEQDDPTVSYPETWGENSKNSILKSQAARATSAEMRAEIDNVVNNAKNGMFRQRVIVNDLIKEKTAKRRQELEQLEWRLDDVKKTIFSMEQNQEYVKKSIQDKLPQKKVVQSRIYARNQRPGIENCRAMAQQRLLSGAGDFDITIAELTEQLRSAEDNLRQMKALQGQISADILKLRKSIYIAEDQCLRLRESIFLEPRIPTY